MESRIGVLVVIEACKEQEGAQNDPIAGLGECSPLPFFHKETLEQAEEQIQIVMDVWSANPPPIPRHLAKLDGSMGSWLKEHCPLGDKLLPSVRSTLEMALLHLLSRAASEPLMSSALGPRHCNCSSDVGINSLVARAEDLCGSNEGAAIVKVKVGRNPLDDARRVNQLAESLEMKVGPHAGLRLDANQAWTIDEAAAFIGALSSKALEIIEYLEEPVQAPLTSRLVDSWSDLCLKTNSCMPLAVDESLTEGVLTLDELEGRTIPIAAIILKPSLQGVEKCLEIAAWSSSRGVQPVISSAFESGVALCHFAILASIMSQPFGEARRVSASHGLGTFSRLEEDVLCTPFADLVRVNASGWQVNLLSCQQALDDTLNALMIARCPDS